MDEMCGTGIGSDLGNLAARRETITNFWTNTIMGVSLNHMTNMCSKKLSTWFIFWSDENNIDKICNFNYIKRFIFVIVLMTKKLHQLYILLSKRENSHELMFRFISAFNTVVTGYSIYHPFEI